MKTSVRESVCVCSLRMHVGDLCKRTCALCTCVLCANHIYLCFQKQQTWLLVYQLKTFSWLVTSCGCADNDCSVLRDVVKALQNLVGRRSGVKDDHTKCLTFTAEVIRVILEGNDICHDVG